MNERQRLRDLLLAKSYRQGTFTLTSGKTSDFYVDGKLKDTVSQHLNRLDVYRALEEVTSPNVGYRIDYDYTGLRPGRHIAQIVAHTHQGRSLLAEREFVPEIRRLRGVSSFSTISGSATFISITSQTPSFPKKSWLCSSGMKMKARS